MTTILRNFSPIDEALRARYDAEESILEGIDCLAFANIPISDEQMDFDLRSLAGIMEASGVGSDPAVAAEESRVGLRNPIASGVYVVVEHIKTWSTTGATSFEIRSGLQGGVVPDTDESGVFRDVREPGSAVGRILTNTDPAGTFAEDYPTLLDAGAAPVNVVVVTEDGWLLPPGFELWVRGLTLNSERQASFAWRERVIGELERSGT